MTWVNGSATARSGLTGAIRAGRRALGRGRALPYVTAVAVTGLLAACGSSGGGTASTPGTASQTSSVISVRQLSGVGKTLVNRAGKTIYSAENGQMCTGSCLSFWLPVTVTTAATLHVPGGFPGTLGTIHRPGGTMQVTYNGKLLYTFRLDQSPGQAKGNNYTDSFGSTKFTWQAVTSSSQAPGSTSSPSSTPSSSGGYGY
ncbi:MAG TPA: hypothetical protein VGI74_13115 [Streptosporangiaceae bacterium]|jgi:predicted lipoprotein with Yx(FWY)xxD motif